MEYIAAIAVILLILAWGAGTIWLAWDNQRTRESVNANPRTRKAMDDRLSAVEERIQTIVSLAEDAQSRVKSLQGTTGRNRGDINRLLAWMNDPEAMAERGAEAMGVDPRELEAYFHGHPIEENSISNRAPRR